MSNLFSAFEIPFCQSFKECQKMLLQCRTKAKCCPQENLLEALKQGQGGSPGRRRVMLLEKVSMIRTFNTILLIFLKFQWKDWYKIIINTVFVWEVGGGGFDVVFSRHPTFFMLYLPNVLLGPKYVPLVPAISTNFMARNGPFCGHEREIKIST